LDESDIDLLYDQARCGLFHDGMTRCQVIYDMSIDQAFMMRSNGSQDLILFHPSHVLAGIEDDFKGYIRRLSGDNNAISKFDSLFSIA
jgi:hypothetical protein